MTLLVPIHESIAKGNADLISIKPLLTDIAVKVGWVDAAYLEDF